jgi:hypothetical protein
LYVCPGKKRTEVPTDGWIHPSSKKEMEASNIVPSYNFDNGPFQASFSRLSEGSIFRPVDQARLIQTVLKEVFNLDEMQKNGFLSCHFVPHHSASLRFFKDHITPWWHPWQGQWPLEHIRQYFGEKCAFEHDFLGFLAGMFFPIGLVAAIQCSIPAHLHSRTAFGVFMIIWAAVLQSSWARRELKHCVDWGMEGCEKKAGVVSGAGPESQRTRFSVSRVLQFCVFEAPTVLIIWTITFQWLLHTLYVWLVEGGYPHVIYIQASVNAIQMLFMDAVCKAAVPRFLKLRDDLTQSESDDALMKHMIVYRSIVGYTSLLLGCFFLPLAGMCNPDDGCDGELGDTLEVIFAIRSIASLMHFAVIARRARASFNKSGQNGGYEQMRHNEAWQPRSYLEAQAAMPQRGSLDSVCDQSEVIIQLGYVLCFGILRPRIALVFLAISLLRVRSNAWSLLDDVRRPFPEMSQGLGVVNDVLSWLVAFAVLSSSALLVLINADAGFVGVAQSSMSPHRFLEAYVLAPTGDMDVVRLLLMIIVAKYVLTVLQASVRPMLPVESSAIASGRKQRGYLLKQLRDSLLGVREELCEAQPGEETRQPERLIRDWVAGAQQLDMDDEDFEPAAAAKLGKEGTSGAEATA